MSACSARSYETGLSGRLTVLEGGEITLNERRYEVERGVITFLDERRIYPSFDLLLNTSAGNYDITLAVTGTPGETETTLTADPTLPEPDIMAMLVTGRTLDEMRGEEYEVAREQVLVVSHRPRRIDVGPRHRARFRLERGAHRTEPDRERGRSGRAAHRRPGDHRRAEPRIFQQPHRQQRSDLGCRVRPDAEVPDSCGPSKRRQLSDGLSPRRPNRRPPGATPVASAASNADRSHRDRRQCRKRSPSFASCSTSKEGKTYDFFAARRGVQRIEEFYRESGYLQSRVRLEREVDEQTVQADASRRPRSAGRSAIRGGQSSFVGSRKRARAVASWRVRCATRR